MFNTLSTTAAALLGAFATEAAALSTVKTAKDAAKVGGLWPVAAAAAAPEAAALDGIAAKEAAAAVAAAMDEAAAAVREIIAAAIAGGASDYIINSVAFPIGYDIKGETKPVSKQAAYVRFSDLSTMFASVAALPPAHAVDIFRANTEEAAILGERAFKPVLAAAKEAAALSTLSPINRLWQEAKLLEAKEEKAAAAIKDAEAKVKEAEAAAAAVRADRLAKVEQAMAGEAAAASLVQENGRYGKFDASALEAAKVEAKEAKEAAAKLQAALDDAKEAAKVEAAAKEAAAKVKTIKASKKA